jgi:hypothetical protein
MTLKDLPDMEYQKLFEYFSNEHDLILLQTEMQDIVEIVREIIEKDSNDLSD